MATNLKIKNKSKPFKRHSDLRELVDLIDEIGELERVDGADWNLEMGALSELVARLYPGRSPALLFDDIPGYPKGFRVLSGVANSLKRLPAVLGLPEPKDEIDLVRSYRERLSDTFQEIQARVRAIREEKYVLKERIVIA